MKFSIIVPIYKVEKYLNKCIQSILNQTYADFELILVDDGSPDNCPKICDYWAEKDNRIKVIHKQNGGVSAARNDGISYATGDYVLFVDGDDYIGLDLLKTCYENLLNKDLDILSFYFCYVGIDGKIISALKLKVGEWNLKTKQEKYSYYSSIITPNCGWEMWTRCFKTSLIKANNIEFPVGYKYAEDFVFVSKCVLKSTKIKQIDFVGYYYVERENSTTSSIKQVPYSETNYMLGLVYDFAKKEGYNTLVENFYIIFDTLMSVLVFYYTNYTSFNSVKNDLPFIKLLGFKSYNKEIIKKYYKNRNTKEYLKLPKSQFVKRRYKDAIYKYAYTQNKFIIYVAALKIKLILFIQKIKIKLKSFLKRKDY